MSNAGGLSSLHGAPTGARDVFDRLSKIGWIMNDAVFRFKLREFAHRWVEIRDLLLSSHRIDYDTPFLGESHAVEVPVFKRVRSNSEESIIVPKEKIVDESVKDTPEPEPTPVDTPAGWDCKRCTFQNTDESSSSCMVCGWFRSRSVEATGTTKPPSSKKSETPVELFIKAKVSSDISQPAKEADVLSEILSRNIAGSKEHKLTGIPLSTSPANDCTVYASRYNLLVSGQAQEESAWINSVERDVCSQHSLDEELLFRKRWLATKRACAKIEDEKKLVAMSDSVSRATTPSTTRACSPGDPATEGESSEYTPEELAAFEAESQREYATVCNSIIGTSFPLVTYAEPEHKLTWADWKRSGVHTAEFLDRLVVIHKELVKESLGHYAGFADIICEFDFEYISDEEQGREILLALLDEPRCDLNLHCLSHVEGDNLLDRFVIPSSMERASLVYSAMVEVWRDGGKTGFVAARPPGHHCPSFEDRLVGLSVSSGSGGGSGSLDESRITSGTRLQREVALANGYTDLPRENGMGFCVLNGLAVAVKRFLQIHNPKFEAVHNRSIRVAILDLDIHAGNGTELVFRNSRSVLHISVHRYGWLKGESMAERVMPGTHNYKDVGGVFGKHARRPKGEGYAVNITLRKGDGNAEVLSAFEGVALPIMQEFAPDIVVVASGFDGLKLSPTFTYRWGEASCPGMDAEYTPSLYGYIVNRVRNEVQSRVIAATEGGYDPISVGLAARSIVKALKGQDIPKPPMRCFNSDWIPQLNNIFQHQKLFWYSLQQ